MVAGGSKLPLQEKKKEMKMEEMAAFGGDWLEKKRSDRGGLLGSAESRGE